MLSRSSARRAFFVALALAALLMVVRVHFGIEWYGDEANALAEPMRYAMGDLPIVDSWHTQFSSGLFLTPVVRLLMNVAHGTTGLVIGFRYAFVLMQVLVALLVWRTLRRVLSEWAAAAIAFTFFWYAPYFYVFPYYNNIAFAALMVAALAVFAGFSATGLPARWLMVAAGLALAVAVIVYPPMLGMFVFLSAGVLGHAWSRRGSKVQALRSLGLLLGVALGVLAVYGLTVLAIASRGPLAASLPHFLHPIDRDMTVGALVARFLRTKAVVGAALACVLTLVVGLATARFTRWPREAVVSAAVVVTCLFAVLAPYLPHSLLYYMDIQQSAMLGVALAVPVLMLVKRDESVTAAFWLLTVPAFGAAACTAFVSYEGFETATMPTVIGALSTLIVLFQWAEKREGDVPASAKAAPLVATVAVAALLMGTTLSLTGGDDAVWRLGNRIEYGPYRSIRTSSTGAEQHDRYMRMLAPIARKGGRVAFVEEFPVGYVLTGLKPGTYSVWTTFAKAPLWQPYLDITGNYPDTIVSTRFMGPNGGVVSAPFAPPFGLSQFDLRYRETYRDGDFVVYRKRAGK